MIPKRELHDPWMVFSFYVGCIGFRKNTNYWVRATAQMCTQALSQLYYTFFLIFIIPLTYYTLLGQRSIFLCQKESSILFWLYNIFGSLDLPFIREKLLVHFVTMVSFIFMLPAGSVLYISISGRKL